jgi:predicted  nucleic acid-binding Zn-ribbon protein
LENNLELLIKLQKLDSLILNKQSIIDEMPLKISETELPLKEGQAALEKIKQQKDLLGKKKRDKERELDDFNEKIKKLKARTTEIKTNKEYQAQLKEIESAEKELYGLEDKILLIMEEMDVSSQDIKLEEGRIKSEKNKLETFKEKLENEISEAEKELVSLKEARKKIVEEGINRETYNLYMGLIESSGGLAVTEVKGEVCQGCNMNIPPQLYVEIKSNEEIIQCPQCHRILYYKSTS